jgi:hypothetical protein
MLKGAKAINGGEVIVHFGPPVNAAEYPLEARGDLLDLVHSLVAAGLPPDQQPLSAESS